jgi:hypothetical protein
MIQEKLELDFDATVEQVFSDIYLEEEDEDGNI